MTWVRLSGTLISAALACLLFGCPEPIDPPDSDAMTHADAAGELGVELGTHVQWKRQPSDFIPLEDGSELPIVLGHQGAWMVVLALRSDGLLVSPVDATVGIEAAGANLGEIYLVEQELDPELDGQDYLYDIWLIVADPSLSTYEAQVSVSVTDAEGFALSIERRVVLSGGLD